MNYADLLTKIAAIPPAFDAFVARYWLRFALVGGLITGTLTLRTCLESGRAARAMREHTELSAKGVRAAKREDKHIDKAVVHLKYRRDSVMGRVKSHDRHIAHTEHQTDSLALLYDEIPAAIAHATDDELFRALSAYRPGAFPDTTGQ